MCKYLLSVFLLLSSSQILIAQNVTKKIKEPSQIAIRASLNSFKSTPQTEGLTKLAPAFGLQFLKSVSNSIDIGVGLDISSLKYPYYTSLKVPEAKVNENYLALDMTVNYKLLKGSHSMLPYAILGMGVGKDKKNYTVFVPVGLGLQFKAKRGSFLRLASTYRMEASSKTKMHVNYGLSYSFPLKLEEKIGIELPPAPITVDQDDDGVSDALDNCPDKGGLLKYNGCPVPDEDNDGINDENDLCPEEEGALKYKGCPVPDTDKDGIADDVDKCPTVSGLISKEGCPIPDTDSDGINDEQDACPTVAGIAANNGCADIQPIVENAASLLKFAIGKATINPKTLNSLNAVVEAMNNYASSKINITGHTDNTGKRSINNRLSLQRANLVAQYLIRNGIQMERISVTGVADTAPIADNKTKEGRAINRRVDLKINY